jgi:sugar lactone lactonase YvrE
MPQQTNPELTELLTGGAFFEAPRWHQGRWWVSDFYRHRVITVEEDGTEELVLEVPGQPSGLGWLSDGDLLVVSMLDRQILRRTPAGEVSVHADLSGVSPAPLNDMVVDRLGRAYVGSFGFDLFGGETVRGADLIRVDPDGRVSTAATDVVFSNGTVISADGRTLVVGETFVGRYSAFDVAEDGTLSGRRVWAQLGEIPPWADAGTMQAQLEFAPDGCDIDVENRIWSADLNSGRCLLLADGGEIVDELHAPSGLQFYGCALGGHDGRTLLLCAAPDYLADRRKAHHEGVLLTTRVAVPGAVGA